MNSIPHSTLAGLFAPLFRYEYFFEITSLDVVGVRSDTGNLDTTISEKLLGSFYIEALPTASGDRPGASVHITNGDVFDRWDRSNDLQRFWPAVKNALTELTRLSTQEDYLRTLSTILRQTWLERFVIAVIEKNRLQISSVSQGQEVVGVEYDADAYGGSYWLLFPDGTVKNFGEDFRYINRRKIFEPFINIMRFGRQDLLHQVFNDFIVAFDKEYDIAISVVDKLKSLADELSRWAFKVYLGNLSNTPLMVESDITLEVTHNRARFLLPCQLLNVKDTKYDEASEPIVVDRKASQMFGFMTAKNQKEMGPTGDTLAKLYASGEGICRAFIMVRKAGLRRQRLKSGSTRFAQTKKP